jgi:hypothetical protein
MCRCANYKCAYERIDVQILVYCSFFPSSAYLKSAHLYLNSGFKYAAIALRIFITLGVDTAAIYGLLSPLVR